MTADKEKPKAVKKLLAGKLKRAEFERTVYRVKPDDGTTLEEMLLPEYWAHTGRLLRPFDIIEVVFEDGARYAELIVIDSGSLWAKVVVKNDTDLRKHKADAETVRQAQSENAPYEVAYKGPSAKWSVIRKSDNERVQDGMASKEEAQKWLDDYQKALAA